MALLVVPSASVGSDPSQQAACAWGRAACVRPAPSRHAECPAAVPNCSHSPYIPQMGYVLLFVGLVGSSVSVGEGLLRFTGLLCVADSLEELDLGAGFGSYDRYCLSASKLPSL